MQIENVFLFLIIHIITLLITLILYTCNLVQCCAE